HCVSMSAWSRAVKKNIPSTSSRGMTVYRISIGMLYRSCTGRPVCPARRRYMTRAQAIRPQVMMPTISRMTHEVTHRPATVSVWFVAAGAPSTKPGRKPWSSLAEHPANATAAATPRGSAAQRRRRFEGTMHLSDLGQEHPKSRATSHVIHANYAGSGDSVEAVAARAAACGVRIVDRESLLRDGVLELDRGAVQVRDAHVVDDDFDAVEVDGLVPLEEALIEVQLVDQARASAGLDGDAKTQVV